MGTPQAQQLLARLRDIRGLEQISWWPAAPGWWILLAVLVTLAAIVLYVRRRRQKKETNLRPAGMRKELEKILRYKTAKKQAAALSEWLRYMAIRRHGRSACAGLEGIAWLQWLSEHDPAGFKWYEKGRILIDTPYAPEESDEAVDIAPLIRAAERWAG